jgi:uncharacterized Ntn-hydrolase superfamily protein
LINNTIAMRFHVLIILFILQSGLKAQDTFSILAFDSITGEVGGAGASCVDLAPTPFADDFIIQLFPGEGGVATQAAYVQPNQVNTGIRFQSGDSPTQLISWMQANDINANPTIRQYGVIRINTGYPMAAAYTGSNCMNYKNHIVGPNYSIQGNILLGQQVLDSMEARFNREPGELACKLMAAMQGANMIGADTRCAGNGSSSLFAFLKVTQPNDPPGQPSFLISLRTANGAGIEPIDSLQVLFDALIPCAMNPVGRPRVNASKEEFSIYPNPAAHSLVIKTARETEQRLIIRNALGQCVLDKKIIGEAVINTADWKDGVYLVEIAGKSKKLLLTGQ